MKSLLFTTAYQSKPDTPSSDEDGFEPDFSFLELPWIDATQGIIDDIAFLVACKEQMMEENPSLYLANLELLIVAGDVMLQEMW